MKYAAGFIVGIIVFLWIYDNSPRSKRDRQNRLEKRNQEILNQNEDNLKKPEVVGHTEDGREVKRYVIKVYEPEICNYRDHFVYSVEGKNTTTENHLVREGKNQRVETTVAH